MAQTTEARTGYPRIPAKNWWDLRRRFRQSPPRQVDASYLQTVLGLSEGAAKNLLPNLKAAGLVDDAGQPTQRAMEWRDDEHYAKVCEDIRQEVYPQTLLDALPTPDPDRARAERWFARETGTGQANAATLAAFYLLVCEADASASEQGPEKRPRAEQADRPRATQRPAPRRQQTSPAVHTASSAPASARQALEQPVVHIDINIHIDSAASAEQIDQVFASMARHLYRREG